MRTDETRPDGPLRSGPYRRRCPVCEHGEASPGLDGPNGAECCGQCAHAFETAKLLLARWHAQDFAFAKRDGEFFVPTNTCADPAECIALHSSVASWALTRRYSRQKRGWSG